ncbi:MAG: leucine-rich repeat protein, partial [Bacteroides cellulosilyticus]|nr:leucine-rich repeat protein [Bacteroides cellulosilyticus]
MKRFFFLSVAVVLLFGCGGDYDDSALLDRMDGLEERVAKLEELCKQLNSGIADLQTLTAALQQNDWITGVVPVSQNGEQVGYTITFAKNGPITVYNGKDGADGKDGAGSGSAGTPYMPEIGVEAVDGVYYWTLDGQPLTDSAGNRIPTTGEAGAAGETGEAGLTPQFKIEEGDWYLSYDGIAWQRLGRATGDKGEVGASGDSLFSDVQDTDDAVIFTLADGKTTITIPRLRGLTVKFQEKGADVEKLEFARNESKTITYTISGLVGDAEPIVKVEMLYANGVYTPTVTPNGATGRINIKTANPTANKLILTVSDGRQIVMAAIEVGYLTTFENAVVSVETPGTLDAVLSAQYDKNKIAELTVVSGTLNDADFATLKVLPTLWSLDLEDADVEALPTSAFEGTLLTEIKLPKTLKKIGARAFHSLSSLKQADIPSGVTEIGAYAFYNCCGLTGALVLPQGLTTIGSSAFQNCSGFVGNLVIPEGVTEIGSSAFSGCTGFAGGLVISQGLTTIGSSAFQNCSGFVGNLVIPQGVTTIGSSAFQNCGGFTGDLVIPEGVTEIGS